MNCALHTHTHRGLYSTPLEDNVAVFMDVYAVILPAAWLSLFPCFIAKLSALLHIIDCKLITQMGRGS